MGISNEKLGELTFLSRRVQRNVNAHNQAMQELQPLLSRLLRLTATTPHDDLGDELADEQIEILLKNTEKLCAKCEKFMPIDDNSPAKPQEG